jgi:hypothetical protein
VVIHRSPRYHGYFPWGRVVRKYRGRCVLVGLREEHEAFCGEFGHVPYHRTADWLDLAEVIGGCLLYVGNQSGPYAAAVGLKAVTVLEVGDPANCHWQRWRAFYGTDEHLFLPDVDRLEALWAHNLALRAEGRTAVTPDCLAALARCVRRAVRLPGDLAEIAMGGGESAAVMTCAAREKTLHLFGSSPGRPPMGSPARTPATADKPAEVREVDDYLAGYRVRVYPGSSPEPFTAADDLRFSVAHLEADRYELARAGIEAFWPRLVAGGCLVLDEGGPDDSPAVEKAVRERFAPNQVEQTAPRQWQIAK